MSTLLAMLFSMTVLGGCSPSTTDTGSTVLVGLYTSTPVCGSSSSQISRTEDLHPDAVTPARAASPRRTDARRRRAPGAQKKWVPERLPQPGYLNNRPYGRR